MIIIDKLFRSFRSSLIMTPDSLNKQQQQKRTKKWARLSYWEYKQRKITDINVRNSTIGICHPENIDDNDESIEFIPISSLLRQQKHQQQQINHQIRMKIGTNQTKHLYYHHLPEITSTLRLQCFN
ncbi:hypothetical protein DERP_007862 [Dermatophagoides pteronyssinus]|uniref:Uncharacterized protein n=1 Tax=Dermatophagoides pteronyssinus TaxID=6956 RepID=A0ABQ8IST8_DERPT|nr:hypothetical protein DERP_007862 [Dermatophagoides pteronyssinus]